MISVIAILQDEFSSAVTPGKGLVKKVMSLVRQGKAE
jgi:hypothetical protein